MSSIGFFVPVIYNNPNKTTLQQLLEVVDEYLCLEDKPLVTIFAPDTEHPQSWAVQNRQDHHRSWINTVFKVSSYFTIILPLIAVSIKALLRCSLQISSIQIDLMAPLKTEIESLPPAPLNDADLQRLLIGLVTSPALGHPEHWVPVMDALMRHLPSNNTVNGIIQNHANMASLLAASGQSISSNQIYQFCTYLGQKQLSKVKPWVGYRVLEQYTLRPELNSTSTNKALKEFLNQKAKTHIIAIDSEITPDVDFSYSDEISSKIPILKFQETAIDSRVWFGLNTENSSLWRAQPGTQNGEFSPMPELLLEVLWTRIQSLQASCIDKPFLVTMSGSAEAELPRNFTLTLAQHITTANIFLYHGDTIDTEAIVNSDYAHGLNIGNYYKCCILRPAKQSSLCVQV